MTEVTIINYVIDRLAEVQDGASAEALIAELEIAAKALKSMPSCYADDLVAGMFGRKGEENA